MEGDPVNPEHRIQPSLEEPAQQLSVEERLGRLTVLAETEAALLAELGSVRAKIKTEVAFAHKAGASWRTIAVSMNMPRSSVHYHFGPRGS